MAEVSPVNDQNMAKVYERLRKIDSNKDGIITRDELQKASREGLDTTIDLGRSKVSDLNNIQELYARLQVSLKAEAVPATSNNATDKNEPLAETADKTTVKAEPPVGDKDSNSDKKRVQLSHEEIMNIIRAELIKHGSLKDIKGEAILRLINSKGDFIPPFKAQLSDEEIMNIIRAELSKSGTLENIKSEAILRLINSKGDFILLPDEIKGPAEQKTNDKKTDKDKQDSQPKTDEHSGLSPLDRQILKITENIIEHKGLLPKIHGESIEVNKSNTFRIDQEY